MKLDDLLYRRWIAFINDERKEGNGIIITLKKGWDFADEADCGVRIFKTVAEANSGTINSKVNQNKIYL